MGSHQNLTFTVMFQTPEHCSTITPFYTERNSEKERKTSNNTCPSPEIIILSHSDVVLVVRHYK